MAMGKFIKVPGELYDRLAKDRRLTVSDRMVLDTALFYSPRFGDPVGLSISMLERATGIPARTVVRSRQNLVKFGYLIQHESGERGEGCYAVATGEAETGAVQ